MSRSYKKPIKKDKTGRWYNKTFRRINKHRIKFGLEPKLMNELVNPYDVSDWKCMPEFWTEGYVSELRLKLLSKFKRK